MKHDPGPWRQGKTTDSIVCDTSPPCAEEDRRPPSEYYGGYFICESVAPRNRNLIKAAPELLEALQLILAYDNNWQHPTLWPQIMDIVRTSIAKAEGAE